MSERRLAARHLHTARVAMFVVMSLSRPIKCLFIMPRTSKRMNERTNERTDWKRLNTLRIQRNHIILYNYSEEHHWLNAHIVGNGQVTYPKGRLTLTATRNNY